MAKKLHVRPREGFEIRDPDPRSKGEVMPPEGARVPNNAYYRGLLRAGMIIDVEAEAAEKAAAEKAAREKEEAAEAHNEAIRKREAAKKGDKPKGDKDPPKDGETKG